MSSNATKLTEKQFQAQVVALAKMPAYMITIPDYLPQRLNVLLRSHWAVRGRHQKTADQLVLAYGKLAGVPKATTRRRVQLVFVGSRSDPDARVKQILDALVHAGLLVDDSERWCELATPRNERGKKATRIVLEDWEEIEAILTGKVK